MFNSAVRGRHEQAFKVHIQDKWDLLALKVFVELKDVEWGLGVCHCLRSVAFAHIHVLFQDLLLRVTR